MQIRWTRTAIKNLEDIEHYISADNIKMARNIINTIIKAIERIPDHPASSRPGRVLGTRELIIVGTPYIVPYRIKSHSVEILRVIHGAMIWPDTF